MRRRDFVQAGALGLLLPTGQQAIGQTSSSLTDVFQLGKRYPAKDLKAVYGDGKIGQGETTGPILPPQMYLFYDRDHKRFLNPLDITPILKPARYKLDATLWSFGISKDSYQKLHDLDEKRDLQLNLQVAAKPADSTDTLSWVFVNAVDVFLGEKAGAAKRLSTFKDATNKKITAPLTQASSQVTIEDGHLDLQIEAMGQRKDGFWRKFLSNVSKIVDSPIFSSLPLPGLTKEALDFTNTVLNTINQQDKLLTVWASRRLEFGVHTGASDAIFKMLPGLWVTVDTDYARNTEFLKGHEIDLQAQSFQLTFNNKPVDATYLVAQLELTKLPDKKG